MSQPTRPLLRWHGGKWRLAPWIIAHFPEHKIFVEPYGGAASVLLRKKPSRDEIYNDLDHDVVNLFRVLRDPGSAARLVQMLELTPFAREEFERAYEHAADPIEEARRLIVRSMMGYGSDSTNRDVTCGFRTVSRLVNKNPARDFANYSEALAAIVSRIQSGVSIECRPALEVMLRYDGPTTLHYVDPPYLPETRSKKARKGGAMYHGYRHELSEADHAELLAALAKLNGFVVLSGYPSELYDQALPGWRCVTKKALADGARPRIEALWLNPAAVQALGEGPLFDAADAA